MITNRGHADLSKDGTPCNCRLPRHRSSSGFTLLEIVIALALIGTVLTVIIYTVNYQAGVSYENTVTTRMYQLAKENLTEMESNPINSEGTWGDTGFSFVNTVKDTGVPGMIEISSMISGDGQEVVLRELIAGK